VRRVLIVDDNVAFAENLAEIVSDAGVAEAVVADSGSRALELLGIDRFDAMVTDMKMPRMSGAELIRRAREAHPALPILVITAFIGDDDLSIAERQGLLSVLPKPAPMRQLLDLIAQA
jgi:CheY-like chemotaxis protein